MRYGAMIGTVVGLAWYFAGDEWAWSAPGGTVFMIGHLVSFVFTWAAMGGIAGAVVELALWPFRRR